jgi:hypothetical protein
LDDPIIINYATPVKPSSNRHSRLLLLAICLMMAYVFALTCSVTATIASTVRGVLLIHGSFFDTDMLIVSGVVATISGIAVYPFFYLAIQSRPLGKSVATIMSVVMVELVAVSAFDPFLGFLFSFVAFGCGLALARRIEKV